MKTLLHLQDLVKSFDHQIVLNHVSFELQTGEIIGLIGPSGAGKSTMIKTMLGMEKADGGEALVLDHTMPSRHIFRRYWLYGSVRCLIRDLVRPRKSGIFWSAKGAL